MLLTKTDEMPDAVMDALEDMDPERLTVLGGTGAVSQAVEDELDAAFPGADGETYEGVGVGAAVGPAPLVNAEDIPAEDYTSEQSQLCLLDSLDPAGADGNIVICTRGQNPRIDKSQAVADAGGIGMIQANTSPDESLNADYHAVPSIHVDNVAGDAVKAYEASASEPTASISAGGQGEVVAPQMAGFSSYGPALAGGGDLLKPDITAPGVDVIAAVAPPGNGGEDFFSYSGTSMSAPHIAGLAALMQQDNPGWSPAAVKSAMMTTADPTDSEGEPIHYAGEPADPLHYGSGEVEPGAAYGPGLVYDAGQLDWLLYACSIDQLQLVAAPGACAELPEVDPSDLNYPSIAIGQLAGEQTVTRTVTNVSDTAETYTAEVEGDGIDVAVEPATFTVEAGATATYEVTITRTTAELDAYTFGSITWVGDAGHRVRSPIAVNPVALAAPDEVSGQGVTGATNVDVTPGYTGVLTSDVDGLLASDVQELEVVSDGPGGGVDYQDASRPITIGEDVELLRVAVFDEEISVAGTDMDIFLEDAEGELVAFSGSPGSDEAFTVEAPEPGEYTLYVDYWNGEAGESAQVPTHVWALTGADEGNLTVTPDSTSVTIGQEETLVFAWDGLQSGSRYLGAVNYVNGDEQVGRTLVSIVTDLPAPQ